MLMAFIEYGVFIAAGGLAGRVLGQSVPPLILLLWENRPRDIADVYLEQRMPEPPRPALDPNVLEGKAFMEAPSAFWLEPGRWQRKTWPLEPVVADLRYDNTPEDYALAWTLCDPEQRAALEEVHSRKVQISSQRRWDRLQGRR